MIKLCQNHLVIIEPNFKCVKIIIRITNWCALDNILELT